MIGQNEFAEAARNTDALAGEHGVEKLCEIWGVDLEALNYTARQRALRCAMIIDGMDPATITQAQNVTLSDEAQALLPHLTAVSMDGLAIGLATRSYHGFYGRGQKRG